MKPLCLQRNESTCEEGFRQRCVQHLSRTFFKFNLFAAQNSLVFINNYCETVGYVGFRRMRSNIIDVHLNIGGKILQDVVYMTKKRTWSLFALQPLSSLRCNLSYFSCSIRFGNHNLWRISVSETRKFVSNQPKSYHPLQIQTVCSYHLVR